MSINIEQLFAPKETDIPYEYTDMFIVSMILRTDSYKFAHPFAYRPGIKAMVCYGTARVGPEEEIVPFGTQMDVKRYFTKPIELYHIEQAEAFAELHFGRKLFARDAWEHVVNKYKGKIPLVIRAVREGQVVPGGTCLYSVSCFDEKVAWMAAGFETKVLRGQWYPTTITSLDRNIKKAIYKFYVDTGADLNMVDYSLHDFGGRGVTCGEQAEIGGCSHTVNFKGSDTIEGILAANHFYNCIMAAFSVYATEHSVECSFGKDPEQELEYIKHQLRRAKELGLKIVSIVVDGYDTMRATAAICSIAKEIIESGIKVVLRPDSGDPIILVPKMLRMLEKAFGTTRNARGFKKLNYVGILQGDGVDHLLIKSILGQLMSYGWAADNIVFGSGGALLQKVNRDTFKFAQKCCAILIEIDGKLVWIGVSKDPITDPGKKSKEGVITLARHKVTGEYRDFRLDLEPLPDEWEDQHILVYHTGQLFNETTMDEVRERAAIH